MDINYNVVKDEYKSIIGKDDFSDETTDDSEAPEFEEVKSTKSTKSKSSKKSKTPVLDNFGNQIENEDGSFEMIEYDGYLDRSRLPTVLVSESSFYSKRAFLDFSRSLIYNNEKNIFITENKKSYF